MGQTNSNTRNQAKYYTPSSNIGNIAPLVSKRPVFDRLTTSNFVMAEGYFGGAICTEKLKSQALALQMMNMYGLEVRPIISSGVLWTYCHAEVARPSDQV